MQVIKAVYSSEDKYFQEQYVMDDGSHVLVSAKYGKTFMQHGKNVPQKNHRVRSTMNEAVARYLKNNPKNV
jgi:hypothetical protein